MKKWKLKTVPEAQAGPAIFGDIPPSLARVLLARGIETEQQLQLFLNPPQRLPYSPMRLSGMEAALQRLGEFTSPGRRLAPETRVGIVGDFDVDGITGTAILAEGLADFGIEAIPYLPHRISEGHGLSAESVHYLADRGAELIITVDCGISSNAEVELSRSLGIDVLVTDHHIPPNVLPAAAAIIDPALPGSDYPFPHLCGAGLAWKLAQGLYQLAGMPMPGSLLELAALGTIADMVPLLDENRYLVREGLVELARTERPGLKALYRLAGVEDKPITTDTVAYQLAPRLNAPGRMGHAIDSLRLLTTRSVSEAETLAAGLENQNRERQQLTRQAFAKARSMVEELADVPPFILVENEAITPGVAGLVAGQLARAFARPSVALARVDEETLVGSGRSIPAFNLARAFDSCAELFVRHGGHSQAAGFTIHPHNVPELNDRLSELARGAFNGQEIEPALEVDAEVRLSDLTPAFLSVLARLEPFGVANPQPLFMSRGLRVADQWAIGSEGQHLKLLVSDGGQQLPALLFNRAGEWVKNTDRVDLVYTISEDTWRGKKQVSLMVEDFQPSGEAG